MSYAKKRADGLPPGFVLIKFPEPEEEVPEGRTYRITIMLDEVEVSWDRFGDLPRENIKIITPHRKFYEDFRRFSKAESAHVELLRLLKKLHEETLR